MIYIAEKFGQLPDAVEEMSVYWFDRVCVYMQGDSLHQKNEERKRKGKR